jgi:HEAT repeat protein
MQADISMMTSKEDMDKLIDKAMRDQGLTPGKLPGDPGPGKVPGDPGPGKQPGDPNPGNLPSRPVAGEPTSIDEALQFLKDRDLVKRIMACDWLAKTPVDEARQTEVARALESQLAEHNRASSLPINATAALKVWATNDSVPALAKLLDAGGLNNPNFADHDAERNAMDTIARLHAEAGADAVARYLMHAFIHDDAVRALQTFGPKAEPAVVKYYFNTNSGANERARQLCKAYGTKDGPIALQAVEELRGQDVRRRQDAAEWLANPSKADTAVQAVVAKALEAAVTNDMDARARELSMKALGKWGSSDSVVVIRKVLEDVNAPQGLRNEATRALKSLGSTDNADLIQAIANLKSNDTNRHNQGLDYFVRTTPDKERQADVAKLIEPLLDDPDDGTKDRAARALVTWATADQSPALIKAIDSRQGGVRQSAMKALGRLKEEKAIVPITQRLTDFGDRQTASQALQDIGSKAETAVATGLTHDDRGVRLEVCKILGVIGSTKDTIKKLNLAAQVAFVKKDAEMYQAANNAIQMIKSRM